MQDNENQDVMENETETGSMPEETEGVNPADAAASDEAGAEGMPEDETAGDAQNESAAADTDSAEEASGDDEALQETGDEEGAGASEEDAFAGSDEVMSVGAADTGFVSDGMYSSDMGMNDTGTETGVKDPILSSVPFVAVTISAALIVGIILGILLGKKRIKKGFDSYED